MVRGVKCARRKRCLLSAEAVDGVLFALWWRLEVQGMLGLGFEMDGGFQ